MYSIRAILDKEPAAIAEGIRAIFLVLVAFGVLSLGEEQMAVLLLGLSALLTLFVRQSSTSRSYPTLASGTSVNVAGSGDKVIIETSPPGPVGVEGGMEGQG